MKYGKKRYDFLDFEKKRKENVQVITYRPVVLKTTVTTLNHLLSFA